MMNMPIKEAVVSTLIHVTELVVCLAASYAVHRLFHLGSDEEATILGVVLNALLKFQRANPNSTLNDYVNN